MVPTTRPDGTPLPPGERHYRVECAACHGLDRAGNPGGGFPSLADIEDRYSKDAVRQILVEAVRQILVEGGGRMPAFDQMPEERRHAIVDYLFGDNESAPDTDDADVLDDSADGYVPPYAFREFQRWLDAEGCPAIKPPWRTLNAVDLNTGEIKWTVPLGEYDELTERGIPVTGTGKLRRPRRDGRRHTVHRRHGGRDLPRLRQGYRRDPLGT